MRFFLYLLIGATLFGADNFKQKVEFGYFGTTGNTDIKSLTAGYALSYKYSKKIKTDFSLDIYYATRNSQKSAERYRAKNSIYFYQKKEFYYFLQTGFLRNTFEGYNQQYNLNPGFGVTVYKSKKQKIDTLIGYLFRRDNYTNSSSKEFNYLKGEAKYQYKLTKKNSFNTNSNYIFNIENSNDFEINFKAWLKLWIVDNLNFKLSYELKYDNLPPVGKKRTDTTTKISIVYNF